MKRQLIAGIAVSLLAVVPALAADMRPAPIYTKAPVIAPAFSWPGFYIGGNVGVGWENTQTSYSYTSFPAAAPPGFEDVFGPGGPLNVGGGSAVSSAIAAGFIPTSLGNQNATFFAAGAQAGYNIQFNQAVFGLEADFEWFADAVKSTSFVAPANIAALTNNSTQSAGLRWLGTVRARAGWAVDRAQFYVTGGFAYGQAVATSSATVSDGTNTDLFAGDGSSTRFGYAVGGGLEYSFTNKSPERPSTSTITLVPRPMRCRPQTRSPPARASRRRPARSSMAASSGSASI
jgi:outer membrane immunogenic protein